MIVEASGGRWVPVEKIKLDLLSHWNPFGLLWIQDKEKKKTKKKKRKEKCSVESPDRDFKMLSHLNNMLADLQQVCVLSRFFVF